MIKPLLCFLLIVLVLTSGFSYPTGNCGQAKPAVSCATVKDICMMVKHSCKHAPCSHNKNERSGQSCAFCMLCCAFVVPFKTGIQRNFATGKIDYPRLPQSELTDFNSSPWRPPAA
jgi:hypothetical protein